MSDQEPFDTPVPHPFQTQENLVRKGDYVDIRKKIPSLREICVGAGWDQKLFEEKALDVDLSCFLLNRDGQTRVDEDFVFYNNEKGCEGAVRHLGDSRTGAGDGDDEMMVIDLNGIPFDVFKIVFTLTIYDALEREQDFGQIRNLYLRFVNTEDNNEIFRFVLNEEEYPGVVGIKVGELVREGPKWFFSALGEPVAGLAGVAKEHGIIVAGV